MPVTHTYRCTECPEEMNVFVKLGHDSTIPECPTDEDHKVIRSYGIGGVFVH